MADSPSPETPTLQYRPPISPAISWTIMILVGLVIWYLGEGRDSIPEGIERWGWRLLAIFVPTILGLMLRPLPGGAIVLIAILSTFLVGATPKGQSYEHALGGYMNKSVWLVLAAYMLSRAIIKTGLARRIALLFVRSLGQSTLGLSYALVGTDTVLAAMIPSNAARVGGVILPITRSLSELYKSFPGKSSVLIGSFLMLTLYQCDVVSCAMFLTGQASNPIAAKEAKDATEAYVRGYPQDKDNLPPLTPEQEEKVVRLNYANWLLYSSVPALTSLLILPWLISKLHPPELRRTPEAVTMAEEELKQMGPPKRDEWIMMLVFVTVCLSWIITGFTVGGKFITAIALTAVVLLLLSRVLTWDDVISEKRAWDVFIWYGGLVQLGTLLKEAQVPKVFASSLSLQLKFMAPALLFLIFLLIYFYAHYGFASITAHIVSMYPAFVGVLLGLGMSPWLVTIVFAYFANLCAGLTHYGTTPGPIIFNTQYVTQGTWWKIGFLISVVNIVIWLGIGLAWWKLLGLW